MWWFDLSNLSGKDPLVGGKFLAQIEREVRLLPGVLLDLIEYGHAPAPSFDR